MKRLIFALAMLPGAAMADTGLIFDDQQAFRVCHDIAMQQSPQPEINDLDLSSCILNQEWAFKASEDVVDRVADPFGPIIARLLPVCMPKPDELTNWFAVYECLTAIERADVLSGEAPSQDEMDAFFEIEENAFGFALNVCAHHPRFQHLAAEPEGSNGWLLFRAGCVNRLVKAVRD